MDKLPDDYRGYTIHAHARAAAGVQWVGLYCSFEIGPDDTYEGVIQGTAAGSRPSEVGAKNAAVVACKRAIDRLLMDKSTAVSPLSMLQRGKAPFHVQR